MCMLPLSAGTQTPDGTDGCAPELELTEMFGESQTPPAPAPLAAAAVALRDNIGPSTVPERDLSHQEYANGAVLARLIEPHAKPRGSFELRLLEAVQQLKAGAGPGALLEPAQLTAHLAGLGYAARAVCAARCAGVALSLKHTFVAVAHVDAHDGPMDLIVEPYLRSHFQISRPSMLYSRLIDDLPDEFVGTGEQLSRLAYFCGDQMTACFQQNGMTVPPWRNVDALLSKWNLNQDRSCSPERGRAALKPPTFARRSVDASRATTAAAAAAAQAAQAAYNTAPWRQ